MKCLNLAIQEVGNLKSGEVFLVKDLFKGYEWNRLAIGERRSMGALFLNKARHGDLQTVLEVGLKSSANQQQYIRK